MKDLGAKHSCIQVPAPSLMSYVTSLNKLPSFTQSQFPQM